MKEKKLIGLRVVGFRKNRERGKLILPMVKLHEGKF
jgi:hypothetical protein